MGYRNNPEMNRQKALGYYKWAQEQGLCTRCKKPIESWRVFSSGKKKETCHTCHLKAKLYSVGMTREQVLACIANPEYWPNHEK